MTRRIARALLVASIIAGGVGWQHPRVAAQSSMPPCGIAMRVLVVSANGDPNVEADLPAITTALDYVGTPYDVFITDPAINTTPLTLETQVCATSSPSATPARGLYQGIILTNNYAAGGYGAMLAAYEAKFGIRQVTWYNTWPSPDEGFNWPTDGSSLPITATLTDAGKSVFPYLRAGVGAGAIVIQNAWTLKATPFDATTVPLATDASGNALVAVHTYADGRVNLAMTFDSNPYLLHSMLLSYGVVNWVTKGLFIGERHTYVSPQIDDIFIDDEQWLASTACGTSVDNTGASHRMTGADLTAVTNWQTSGRQQPLTADLKITMAFNGLGTSPDYTFKVIGSNDTIIGGSTGGAAGLSSTDTLTLAAVQQQHNYFWTSHTYDHENLDHLTYAASSTELSRNIAVATQLGLDDFTTRFMVQPDVSGLDNADFLRAAYDNGIRLVLSNTSKVGQNNPTPNTGYWNAVDPRIFVIPRRANNLFFNVATPADWVQEYNCLYGPTGSAVGFHFDHNLSYAEIIDFISNELLADLLRGELDPWMFHQTNLAAYDGTHTLLGDLLDVTFQKYGSYMTFPIVSPSIDALGGRMKDRTAIRTRGVDATIQPNSIVFTSPVDVTVPVTGLTNGAELYAGQWIAWVPLSANVSATIPFVSAFAPELSSSSDGAGIRSVTVTTSQPRELLVAFVGAGGPSTSAQSATVSGAGLAWTLVQRVNTQAGTSEIWTATSPTVLSNATVTSTLTQSGYHQMLTVMPFTGSGGIGAFAGANGASSAPSVSLTTTKRNSRLYAVGSDPKHAAARTPGTNQVKVHEFIDTAVNETYWIQQVLTPEPTAPTTVRLYDTAPTKDPWNFAAVEIVPAATATTIPNVVNMTQASASTAILAAGLNVGVVTNDWSSVVPPGTVISQSPAGGAPTLSQTSVDLVVSKGVPVTVPNVVNMTQLDATSAITNLGLKVGTITTAFSATAAGSVASQSPVGDTQAIAGSVVSMVISSGPTPTSFSSDGNGTRSVAVTTSGPTLLVAFAAADGANSPQTLTVSGGSLTWRLVRRANGQNGSAEIWSAMVTTARSFTVTSTEGRSGYPQSLTVVAFDGASGVGSSSGNSANNTAPGVSLVTTSANSLVFGVGEDHSHARARTLGTNQVMIHEWVDTAGDDSFWVQARNGSVPAAGTSVQVNDTAPTNDRWNLAAVEIVFP
jgi:PASTA domain